MKKVLSLMLVLVLVLGMSTVAFATTSKIKLAPREENAEIKGSNSGDVEAGRGLGSSVTKGSWTETWYSNIVDFSDCVPTSDADPDDATDVWYGLATPGSTDGTYFTKEDIKSAKVTLKTVITKGAKAIDGTAYWDYTKRGTDNKERYDARVALDFNEWYTSNNPDGVDYEVKIYLVVEGRQWSNSGITLDGNYANRTDTYYEATDGSVYMGDGTIIQADGYMKSVEMDLSEGVFAYGKMFKDRYYYGVADINVYDKDAEFFDKYEIDAVYHINEAGLKAVVDYIVLENEDSSSYVYTVDSSGNLVYTGKNGADKLDLADTYYLSTKMLDVDEEVEPEENGDPSDAPEDPSDGGGDDYPDNVNDNPGTGR